MDVTTEVQKQVLQNNWVNGSDGPNTKILLDEEDKMRGLKLQLIDRHEDVQVSNQSINSFIQISDLKLS